MVQIIYDDKSDLKAEMKTEGTPIIESDYEKLTFIGNEDVKGSMFNLEKKFYTQLYHLNYDIRYYYGMTQPPPNTEQ